MPLLSELHSDCSRWFSYGLVAWRKAWGSNTQARECRSPRGAPNPWFWICFNTKYITYIYIHSIYVYIIIKTNCIYTYKCYIVNILNAVLHTFVFWRFWHDWAAQNWAVQPPRQVGSANVRFASAETARAQASELLYISIDVFFCLIYAHLYTSHIISSIFIGI